MFPSEIYLGLGKVHVACAQCMDFVNIVRENDTTDSDDDPLVELAGAEVSGCKF